MIEMTQLHKTYLMGDTQVHALNGLSLTIGRGELVAIMGSSGSGKSTLLNVIGALDSFDSGSYRFSGKDLHGISQKDAALFRRDHIGFVFQSFHLLPYKTALDNVILPLKYQASVGREERRKKAAAMLCRVGLHDRMNHLPAELSGGQQQRVAIARALVTGAPLLLADEPTGALDSATTEEIMNLLIEINTEGKTVVIVTHEDEIARRTHRIIRMKDGVVA
ncbi:MAG: ABC transporter ATP-binding protein [Spirochaetales bacterium]|nr:ABC transporter ATP-binding protein [Spirochaetales bacterium]